MKKAIICALSLLSLGLQGQTAQLPLKQVKQPGVDVDKNNNKKTQAEMTRDIGAQACAAAKQDVTDAARGYVIDPRYLEKQEKLLEQCREAGLLLDY